MQQSLIDRLYDLVIDPLFWIVTILIGLIVSILANYATRGSDRIISLFSRRMKEKIDRDRKFALNNAIKLIGAPDKKIDTKLDIIEYLLRGLLSLIFVLIAMDFFIMILMVVLEYRTTISEFKVFLIILVLGLGILNILSFYLAIKYLSKEQISVRILDTYRKLKEKAKTD